MSDLLEIKKITAEKDHLKKIAKSNPGFAIAELVWNSLDGDATIIDVKYVPNDIGGTEKIIVTDNGLGFPRSGAEEFFRKLGGSWKKTSMKSEKGRMLHGKNGQGRFKAFSLGEIVTWKVYYKKNDKTYYYEIHGKETQIDLIYFTQEEISEQDNTGVEVEISNLFSQYNILDSDSSLQVFPPIFAPYLNNYPEVVIKFNGMAMNINEQRRKEINIPITNKIKADNYEYSFTLTLIEWNEIESKELYFCDKSGFPLKKYDRQIRSIGAHGFVGYLCSDYYSSLNENNSLDLVHMNSRGEGNEVVNEALWSIKRYFSERYIEEQKSIIDTWKNEDVYPYRDIDEKDEVKTAEKQVFDILALNLNDNIEDFNEINKTHKKLQFRLLKQAIESNPSDLGNVLKEVVSLPKQSIKDLEDLLEYSSLTSIISASKTITDRIKFIIGIREIVFNRNTKKQLKERSQLHKILADNTWLFGDEFHLSVSDQSLTQVLKKHRKILGNNIVIDEKVTRNDGSMGIIDLMLSRLIPKNREHEYEHLIIELKAPNVKIDIGEINQIESYALAVASDERFNKLNVRWEFWIISNEIKGLAKVKANQSTDNIIQEYKDFKCVVKAKTWSQVLSGAEYRYKFVREQLQLSIGNEDGLNHLREKYSQYVGNLINNAVSD